MKKRIIAGTSWRNGASLTCIFVLTQVLSGLLQTTVEAQGNVRLIADLNPGANGSFPSNLTVFGSALYFSGYTTNTGRELWKYDSRDITLVSNINDTVQDIGSGVIVGNDSNPHGMTVFSNALFFTAFDPRRGGELWQWNGTSAARVADINPDANNTVKVKPDSSWPEGLTIIGNRLYFSATDDTHGNYELWSYDGATASLVDNIHPDTGSDYSSYPQGLTVFDGAMYFEADNGTNGFELWKRDSGRSTQFDINPGENLSSSYPKYFTAFGGWLYFQAFTDEFGYELWRTDGTNTTMVVDLNPGSASSFPEHLTVYNDALYFSADDGALGAQLWRYDGNSATVAAVIHPAGNAYPKNLTVFGGLLLFAADDGIRGWELWKFDGTTAFLVTDLNPDGDSFPESLTVFNQQLYFVATTPTTGYELWKYDGANVSLASDINPGAGSSFPLNLAVFNNELCFSASDDGSSNWELWALSGAIAPLHPVSLLSPVIAGTEFIFSFESEVLRTYDVQTTETLGSDTWRTLGTMTGNGGLLSVTNSIPAGTQGFYRVESK